MTQSLFVVFQSVLELLFSLQIAQTCLYTGKQDELLPLKIA